tara:strand:+ start:400 stop:642 length:243 start_codon:yes stop_codon:yes gene_type:complete
VVEAIEGVMNDEPLPKEVPPEEFENQSNTPLEAVAFKSTVPGPVLEPGVVAVIEGVADTVTATELVCVFPEESLIVTEKV